MFNIVWVILRRKNHFLMTQRETWTFPGGPIENETPITAAYKELKEEVDVGGKQFRKLGDIIFLDEYHTQIFDCHKWEGKIKPGCGWFTIEDLYLLGDRVAPFVNEGLPYIAYLTQHYG